MNYFQKSSSKSSVIYLYIGWTSCQLIISFLMFKHFFFNFYKSTINSWGNSVKSFNNYIPTPLSNSFEENSYSIYYFLSKLWNYLI